jgi:hypothetical protein
MTSSRRVKPEIPAKFTNTKNYRLIPDSHQTQTPSDLTKSAIVASFVFLATRVVTVRT